MRSSGDLGPKFMNKWSLKVKKRRGFEPESEKRQFSVLDDDESYMLNEMALDRVSLEESR